MTILQAFRAGVRQSIRYWRISLVLYAGLAVAALLGALPWRSALYAEVGQSLILKDLIKGFNYTFLNDFLQNYGSVLAPALQTSLWSIVIFFISYLFLSAGTVAHLVQRSNGYNSQLFWGGAGQYFWRFLRLTLYFLLLHTFVLVLFGGLYWKVTKGLSPQALETEEIITSCLRWIIPLYLFALSWVLLWQDYAKISLARNDSFWVWPSVRAGAQFAFKQLRISYPTYLLFVGIQAISWWLFHHLDMIIERTDTASIWLAFWLFQLAIIIRLFWRIANWAAIEAIIQKDQSR